jgi:hypothetical protein
VESQILDETIEGMSPGYISVLEENKEEVPDRADGKNLAIGSYSWCNSHESDKLCDSDWDEICGEAFDEGPEGGAQRRIRRSELHPSARNG